MVTYYAAQLGIALSVVDSRHIYREQARRNKEAIQSCSRNVTQSTEKISLKTKAN